MSPPPTTPRQLGRFRIFAPIGQGGMGAVYAGFDLEAKEFVAVKTLFADLSDDEVAVARFGRECEISGLLDQTNVVRFFDAGVEGGTRFLALEYVRGRTVGDMLTAAPRIGPAQVVEVMEDLGAALQHVHDHDVIHRDLKPDNVIINQDGILKLIDFGIGMVDYEDPFTPEGLVVGTCGYSSPEQNQGHDLGPTSDLYSLGALAWHALVGRRWAEGTSPFQVAMCQLGKAVPPPSTLVPGLPAVLDEVVLRLMAREPGDRYQDADELLRALGQLRKAEEKRGGTDNLFADPIVGKWAMAKRAYYEKKYPLSKSLARYIADRRPDFAPVHFLLGKLYAHEAREFNSTDSFQTAMRLDPGNLEYRADIALSLYRLNMFSLARQELENLIQARPDHPLGRGFLALVDERLSSQRRAEAAEQAAREAPRETPEAPKATNLATLPPPALPAGTPPPPAVSPPAHVRLASLLGPGLGRVWMGDLAGALRVGLWIAGLALVAAALWFAPKPALGWELANRDFIKDNLKRPLQMKMATVRELASGLVLVFGVLRWAATAALGLVFLYLWRREHRACCRAAVEAAHAGAVLETYGGTTCLTNLGGARGLQAGAEVLIVRALEGGQREFPLGRVRLEDVAADASYGTFLPGVGVTEGAQAGDELRALPPPEPPRR